LIASRSEQILLAVGLIAVLSAVLTYFVARRISRPLMVLEQGAGRFAAGDLTYRLPTATAGDVASLAETFNQMAATLNERIATITQQRNELEAVLANMDEAVLVVDVQKRLLRCNALAARLYAFDRRSAIDRPIAELVHHAEALDFVDRVLASAKPLEKIFVSPDGRRFWQVRGTLLRSAADDTLGALVVLRDVTADYRLEQVRRDFVANVSHELKTPITSIKGFVETLRDGAIHETTNAEKFLEIIGRHVERVEAIIEDLLALSRIEQEEDKAYLYLAPTAIHEVLESAMLVCGGKARDKNITILTDCLTDLRAKVNPALLEQAIVNLLDNAIKYSPPDSRIELRAAGADGNLQVSVTDQGSGISAEHLPRIFERFYRVDKARSRKLGGTGLGLAIVKHLVQAMGGTVRVRSAVGRGTVFTVVLPAMH
jgi:two-component system phosphate regulon sensor histidine kinase PhoR